MKKSRIITFILLSVCFYSLLCFPHRVHAAVKGIPLEVKKNIKKYDVTGDGVKDVVRIDWGTPSNSDDPNSGPWTVKVNGEIVYRSDPKKTYTEFLTVTLYPLDDDRIYLYIVDEVGANDDINGCMFYQYQSGEWKKVCDILEPMTQHKSLFHIYVTSLQVASDEIRVSYTNQFSATGYLDWDAVYRYRNKKWRVDGDIYPSQKKKLTANRKIILYKKPGGKSRSLVLKKGQKVTVKRLCLRRRKTYVQAVLPDGRKGWMESPGKYHDNRYYFKEVVFAG